MASGLLRRRGAPLVPPSRALRGLFVWLCAWALAGGAASARGERAPLTLDAPVEVEAERLEYLAEGRVYVAEGAAVIRQAGRTLEADWLAVSLDTRRGVASGRVRIRDGVQAASADFMEFELDALAGVLFEAAIDTGPGGFAVEGRELRRRSDRDYALREGGFTSCRCPEPDDREPWRVETGSAELELGGYGTATASTVEVLGVPVAWLPWVMFPVKTERETGLLAPELAFGGRSGVQVGLPFFWAARHDVGVVAMPRWLEERGFGGELELEYLLGDHSGGELRGAYLRDESAVPGVTPYDADRWAVLLDHDQSLPLALRARVDAKAVSDDAWLDDFDEYALYRRDLFLHSRAFAAGSYGRSGRVGVLGALSYADDIRNPLGLDRDATLLHRIPELGLRLLPGAAPLGLQPSLDGELAYFLQRDDPLAVDPSAPLGPDASFLDAGIDPAAGAADPTRGDGRFEPGEPLLEHGTRVVLHPRLARPFAFGRYAELRPEVGYAQFLYDGSRRGFAERGLANARADLRTRLLAAGGLGSAGVVEHRLEPFVRYTLVRTRDEAAAPVFVPAPSFAQERLRQLAPESFVLDPSDRAADANVLAVGFDNALRLAAPGAGADRLRADLWLSFQHDFDRASAGRLVAGSSARLRPRLDAEASVSWDAGGGVLDEGLLALRYGFADLGWLRSPYLSGRYRFLRTPPRVVGAPLPEVDQLDFGAGVRLADRLLLEYGLAYSLQDGTRLSQSATVVYASRCQCFALGFDVVEDRTRDVYFRIRYSITGLGDRSGDPFAARRGLVDSARR